MKRHYKEYTKEDIAIREFKKLKGFVGDTVYVAKVTDKGYEYKEGTLMNVDGFVDITLDDNHIPFISEDGSINAIYTNDRRAIIFSNPYVNKSSYNDVEKLKRSFFGDRIVDIQIKREEKKKLNINNLKRDKDDDDISLTQLNMIKIALIRDSIKYVPYDMVEEWIKYISDNIVDRLSCMVITKVFISMKDLSLNGNIHNAINLYLHDNSLTEDIKDYMTLVLAHFSYQKNEINEIYNLLKEGSKNLTLK